jgi:hypothetical protein
MGQPWRAAVSLRRRAPPPLPILAQRKVAALKDVGKSLIPIALRHFGEATRAVYPGTCYPIGKR